MNRTSDQNKSGRPTTKKATKPHLMRAVEIVGSVGKLADMAGVNQTVISMCLYTERKIPANRVNLIVKATNNEVKAWQLRPDVFEKA